MNEKGPAITPELLRENNHCFSAWIAVRGVVYDVTTFRKRHPGGEQIMLMASGRDATIVVETYHSLSRIQAVLENLPVVGHLVDLNPMLPEAAEISAFHKSLRENAQKYFADCNERPKYPPVFEVSIKYAGIFAAVVLIWLAQFVFFTSSLLVQIVFAVLMGISCALVGLHPLHDASHCSITRNPRIWLALGATHDFLNGASSAVWFYQHVLGHHPYTNVEDADPDITVHKHNDIRRILPNQPWKHFYRVQHIIVPILYAFLAWKTRLQDIAILYITKSNGNIPVNPPTATLSAIFWLGKIAFLLYRVLIPIFVLPSGSIARVLLLLTVSDIVTSYWLALSFQANHVVTEVKLPVDFGSRFMADDPKRSESSETLVNADCWAVKQLDSTLDYAIDNSAVTFLVGSLNLQAVHHIFPGIHQYYYPQLVLILKQTCAEYGIKYRSLPTFSRALASHIMLLKSMGSANPKRKIN